MRGSSSTSISYCSSAVLAEVLPRPASRRSMSTTSLPRLVRASATSAPVTPAPMMAMSHCSSRLSGACECPSPLRTSQKGAPECRSIDQLCRGARNSHKFLRDILRRKDEVHASARHGALRHVRLHGGLGLLRDGDAPHVLYACLLYTSDAA